MAWLHNSIAESHNAVKRFLGPIFLMVTQGNIDAIRARAGRFFAPVDPAVLAARKKAALVASLPDWDSQSDTILERSLLPEAMQTQAEFETQHANLLRSLILFAQGIDLDVHGLEFPAVLRLDGESDDAYLLRLVNRYSLLSLGSLAGYEDQVRQLLPAVDDVRAVEHRVSRNVSLFALTADRTQLTAAERQTITTHYEGRGSKIAGISVRLVEPAIETFYIHVYAVYSPRQSGADEVVSAVTAAVRAYLAQTEAIGAAVWSTGIQDAAWVTEALSVGVQVFRGDPDFTDIAPLTLFKRNNGVWSEIAENVGYVTEAPGDPVDDQYIVSSTTQFNVNGQTFNPTPPTTEDLYQYDAATTRWNLVGTNRGGPVYRNVNGVHALTSAFIPPAEIQPNDWYLFVGGYPALKNDHTPVADDLVGDDAPTPALAAQSTYAAATLWHCPSERIFVTD